MKMNKDDEVYKPTKEKVTSTITRLLKQEWRTNPFVDIEDTLLLLQAMAYKTIDVGETCTDTNILYLLDYGRIDGSNQVINFLLSLESTEVRRLSNVLIRISHNTVLVYELLRRIQGGNHHRTKAGVRLLHILGHWMINLAIPMR
jgi:hypothetical protein